MPTYSIAPSILSADFARLGEDVSAVLKAGADIVHIDVMDNHYVPNLTFGPIVCEALRNFGVKAPFDVHLMTKPVDNLITSFAKAGANSITFHPEASEHVHRTIQLIQDQGCKAGIALNPATPLNVLDYILQDLDLILVMSVNPGFGGQKFIPQALDKIRLLKKLIQTNQLSIDISVDGGVTEQNIAQLASAGANIFVAGTAIFKSTDYAQVINNMREQLATVANHE